MSGGGLFGEKCLLLSKKDHKTDTILWQKTFDSSLFSARTGWFTETVHPLLEDVHVVGLFDICHFYRYNNSMPVTFLYLPTAIITEKDKILL